MTRPRYYNRICYECGAPVKRGRICDACRIRNTEFRRNQIAEIRNARNAQNKKAQRKCWRCIAGDPFQPSHHFIWSTAFESSLKLGNWIPGSVWEREGQRFIIVGDVGTPQRMEPCQVEAVPA